MSRAERRPAALDLLRLERELAATPFAGRVLARERVGSTNDEIRRLAAAGAEEGTVVIAEAQTAGRGRRGRSWHSAPGLGLYVSVLFRGTSPVGPPTRWTLAAAVAACEACRRTGRCDVRIEWPNDLFHGRRKLGGILTELRSPAPGASEIVIGAGINVAHRASDLPPELADVATSLHLAGGEGMLDRETLAAAYLGRLAELAHRLRHGGWNEVASRWESLAPGCRGRRVRIVGSAAGPADGRVGVTDGIDTDGALLVRGADGLSFAVRMADAVLPVED